MISRCIYCNDVCPDFTDICDCCAYIEIVDDPNFIPENIEDDLED